MKRLVWLGVTAVVWGSAACSTIFGDVFIRPDVVGGEDVGHRRQHRR